MDYVTSFLLGSWWGSSEIVYVKHRNRNPRAVVTTSAEWMKVRAWFYFYRQQSCSIPSLIVLICKIQLKLIYSRVLRKLQKWIPPNTYSSEKQSWWSSVACKCLKSFSKYYLKQYIWKVMQKNSVWAPLLVKTHHSQLPQPLPDKDICKHEDTHNFKMYLSTHVPPLFWHIPPTPHSS